MQTRSLQILIGTLVLGVASASAQEPSRYVCLNGSIERRIEVIYETGLLVPCEVHYFKESDADGASQVLWRAQNEEGYCEARAAEFAEKLRGWGWQCDTATADDGGAADAAADTADDTEALAPSDADDSSEPPR